MKITIKQFGASIRDIVADTILPILGYLAIGYFTTKARKFSEIAFEYGSADDGFSFNEPQSGYGRAVNAILNSDMSDFHKSSALGDLKRGKDNSYYEAVIAVCRSNMSSYHQSSAIENMK